MRIPATVNRSQAQSTFNKREIRCLWNTYDHLQSSWLAREKKPDFHNLNIGSEANNEATECAIDSHRRPGLG